MKIRILTLLLALSWGTCRGDVYFENFNHLNLTIPDGNPIGVALNGIISGITGSGTVGGLSVGLNVSGGYNGDLYAYLVAPNGSTVGLLNHPGVTGDNPFGAGGSGLNVTFSDTAAGGIQSAPETAGMVLTGSYQAAGSLSGLNGSSANGAWTLFLADTSAGGGQATLNGFSLSISVVPEPVNVALGIFGMVMGGIGALRWYGRTRK